MHPIAEGIGHHAGEAFGKLLLTLAAGLVVLGVLVWIAHDMGYKAGVRDGAGQCIDDLNAMRADYEMFKTLKQEIGKP